MIYTDLGDTQSDAADGINSKSCIVLLVRARVNIVNYFLFFFIILSFAANSHINHRLYTKRNASIIIIKIVNDQKSWI